MKTYQNKKSAFTLIELSIIILILGLLIVGTTKGLKVVNDSKIQTARSLTNSSPVHTISKLALWYDATAEKAFDTIGEGLDDGGDVTTWRDMNQQSITKYDATQGASGSEPHYILDAINGLPAVKVDGDRGLELNLTSLSDSYTLFFVLQYGINSTIIKSSFTGLGVEASASNAVTFQYSGLSNALTTSNPLVEANVVAFFQDSTRKTQSFTNGVFGQEEVTNLRVPDFTIQHTLGNPAGPANLGSKSNYIGEFIAFNKRLTDKEIKSVNDYLIQKWKIE